MSERRKVLELFEKKEWREKAEDGIKRYRMGDACINVTDKSGKPVCADVTVKQKTHEFRFGANIFMLDELESDEKNEIYKKKFAEIFNMATLPFYWDTLEPERGKPRYAADSPKVYRRPTIDKCIEYCEEHGIEPREHALAYDRFFPKWLSKEPTEVVKRELERRFREIGERYADKIRTIEVTNEMFWDGGVTPFYFAPEYIEWCFKTARKYFPNNELGINEWTGAMWDANIHTTNAYYSYIEANLLKGAPIDAIGMQYHMFIPKNDEYKATRRYYNPEHLFAVMDMYSLHKKPLQITEITIPAYSNDAEDEDLQAEIIENLYTIWFSHPNVEQIIYWNVVDGYAHVWAENATHDDIRKTQGDMTLGENIYYGGLLRFDMTEKPAFKKLHELINERWHTEASMTCKDGRACFSGFYGDYDVTVRANGKEVTNTVSLSSKGDNNFNIEI